MAMQMTATLERRPTPLVRPLPRQVGVRQVGARQMSRPTTRPAGIPTRAATYRRRRVGAVLLGAVFVVLGARGADAVVSSGSHHVHDATKVVHYAVQPGDTLWTIAHTLAPGDDPREVVDLLAQAHGGATIHPGDVIDWAGR